MFQRHTNWLQQWIPGISAFDFFMYATGAGIKFPQLWEQSNKSTSIIPLANTDMIARDYEHCYDCTGLPTLILLHRNSNTDMIVQDFINY